MTMAEWENRLDAFLSFNERELLAHAGEMSAQVAEKLAHDRYEAYDAQRRSLERARADAEDMQAIESLAQYLPARTKGKAT